MVDLFSIKSWVDEHNYALRTKLFRGGDDPHLDSERNGGAGASAATPSTVRPLQPPCARDLSLDAYKIWLVSRYGIVRNEVLDGFVCDDTLFPSTEAALAHAHGLELTAIGTAAAEADRAGHRRAQLQELLRLEQERHEKQYQLEETERARRQRP